MLAKTFTEIHKIKLDQNVERKETFKPHFSQDLIKWINELKGTHKDNIFTDKLWNLIKPVEEEIKNKIKELDNIGTKCQELPQNFVFCNTDPGGDNIIISNNECFLVDWDGAIFAPAEHDIWFYLENKDFFEEYKRNYPEIQVFKENITYYMYFRIFEDLTDWIYRIMYEKQSDEENEKDLLDLQTDCLIELNNMEEKIEKKYKTTLV